MELGMGSSRRPPAESGPGLILLQAKGARGLGDTNSDHPPHPPLSRQYSFTTSNGEQILIFLHSMHACESCMPNYTQQSILNASCMAQHMCCGGVE